MAYTPEEAIQERVQSACRTVDKYLGLLWAGEGSIRVPSHCWPDKVLDGVADEYVKAGWKVTIHEDGALTLEKSGDAPQS
jgi:hypothetical protein